MVAEGDGGADNEEEWERVVREERAHMTTYALSKSMHDLAFCLVNSFRPLEMTSWDEYIGTEIGHIRSCRFPEVTV